MRKSFVVFPLLALAVLFSACGSNESYTAYRCPMKCEGAKTYPQPGKCPVCEMTLEGVSSK